MKDRLEDFAVYWFYFLSNFILLIFIKLYHRAELTGLEHAPRKGPVIFVANHSSFLDPWYLAALYLLQFREIRYMTTTHWYYKNWFWKSFLYLSGCFPVRPGNISPSTIKRALKILKRGGVVGIFPEGAITYDGELQEFNPGACYLAMKANAPIIPVAICGTFRAFPRQQRFPRPRKIKFIMGKPIHFSAKADHCSKDAFVTEMQKIKEWIGRQTEQFDLEQQGTTAPISPVKRSKPTADKN